MSEDLIALACEFLDKGIDQDHRTWRGKLIADLAAALTAALSRAEKAEAERDALRPETLSLAQLDDACLSYRHDYGLMTVEQREDLRRQAADWWRCFARALATKEQT